MNNLFGLLLIACAAILIVLLGIFFVGVQIRKDLKRLFPIRFEIEKGERIKERLGPAA